MPALLLLAVALRFGLFILRYGSASPDWSDFLYYHDLAALSAQGFYPDIHFWVEYPPIFPWLAVGAYRLSLVLPPWSQPSFWFDLILTAVLTGADVGSLVAIDWLGDALWGKPGGRQAATIYAALFLPALATVGWFDPIATCFLLLGLVAFLSARGSLVLGGMAVGIGIMVKLFPIAALVALAVVAQRNGRDATNRSRIAQATIAATVAAATIAVIGAPLFVLGRETFLATFRNVLARGAWMSPWAILDGFYGTGVVASLHDRLFFNASASWGQPARDPALWWLAVAVGVAIFSWRARTALEQRTPRAAIALTALAVTMGLLLSRGFSQQFTGWVLPFVVLLLPGLDGVILAILLTFDDVILEGYVYVTLLPDLHRLLALTVTIRTILLLWFAVEAAAAVAPGSRERFHQLRRRLRWPALAIGVAAAAVASILLAPSVVAAAIGRSGGAPVAAALRELSPNAAVIFTQQPAYDRFSFATRPRQTILVAEPSFLTWTGDRSLDRYLTSAIGERAEVALVADTSPDPPADLGAVRRWLGARFGSDPPRTIGGVTIVDYRRASHPVEHPVGAVFGQAIQLVGYSPADPLARAGALLTVTLHWVTQARLDHDYSVSLQLLDAAGTLVAQHDAMPVENTLPTTSWRPGEDVLDPISLSVPTQLTPANYQLIVVVYDHLTLQRLPVSGNGAAGDHAIVATVVAQ